MRNLLLLLLVFSQVSFAQNYYQSVRGRVVDKDSKSPLIGANIIIIGVDTFLGAATDVDGKFKISKVPTGRRSIKVSFIGYEELVLNNVIVSSGKEVVLQIEMRETIFTANTVEIVFERDKTKANNELTTLSARNFQKEETERYAGSRGDPSRMVANYAGVATGNDARNDIIVRGNSPLGVLWRLEDVDIPNPNHFSAQGATGGPVSMLNNNVLANSDFLTGAFPAEYGDKNAAVFDLKLRNGNNEHHEFTGQFGINGFEGGIEGPISKKTGSSFLVNYRYSTLELFNALGISFGVSGIPKYQDLSFKINLPTPNAGTFSFWGLGGTSDIQILDSKKKQSDWSYTQKGEDLSFGSSMGVVGFTHLYFFNSKVSGKLSVAVSGNLLNIVADSLSKTLDKFRTYYNYSTDSRKQVSYAILGKISAKDLIKTGVRYSNLGFDYYDYSYDKSNKLYRFRLNENGETGLFQSYVQWQHKTKNDITFNTGLHFQNLLINNSHALEPRFGVRWQVNTKNSFAFAYGNHSQTQPLLYYFYKSYIPKENYYVQTNKSLDLTKSKHFVAAIDHSFNRYFRLKFEGYYQDVYNVPVEIYRPSSFSMLNVGTGLDGLPLIDSLGNAGTGKNYGIECTLEKFFSKHYYFLSTITLYQSKYQGSDLVSHNTAFNGGYVYNALLGVEISISKGNKTISLDGKATFAGGNRYTPIDIKASNATKDVVYLDKEAYSKKFDNYQRVDIKVSFKMNQKRVTQTFFINIENVLNRKNILREVYNSEKQAVVKEYQLGLFPYGGFRIEF